MKYTEKYKPLTCMMTQSSCYRGTKEMKVVGVLWHSTGANNPYVKRYVQPDDKAKDKNTMLLKLGRNAYGNDWNHKDVDAGVNAWIGKLADGSVAAVQTLPWNYRPWGCASGKNGSCNDGWIQFEICEDALTDKAYFNKVYTEACELTAYLCKTYGIDPMGTVTKNGVKVPTILCHKDSFNLGMGSDHADVYHWFKKHDKDMDDVRKDVKKLLEKKEPVKAAPATPIKVGEIVNFTGTRHYSNSNASSGAITTPSKAKVTATDVNGKHPYHLRAIDDSGKFIGGKVYGWVDAAYVKQISTAEENKSSEIETGDYVKITGTKYYNGVTVPSWVLAKTWIVEYAEKGNNRVVLNKSNDLKFSINSPFKRSDLKLVRKK